MLPPRRILRGAPPMVLVLLAALGGLAAASLALGARNALRDSADLLRRAEEVALVLDRANPYEDPDMTYPPAAPLVFTPLVAPFRGGTLRPAWIGINLLALAATIVGTLRLAAGSWPSWLRWAFALAVAASKPVRLTLGLGQFSLLPLALMLGAVLAARRDRWLASGLALGIALVKPTLSLPLVTWFVVRRRWRVVAVAVAFQGLATLAVSAWLGIGPLQLTRKWLDLARDQQTAGLVDLPSAIDRFWPGGGGAVAAPVAVLVLVATAAACAAWRRRSDLALVSLTCCAAALFTYHRPYDLVLFAPALAFQVERARVTLVRGARSGLWRVALAALFLASFAVPAKGLPEPVYNGAFVPIAYLLCALTARDIARDEAA